MKKSIPLLLALSLVTLDALTQEAYQKAKDLFSSISSDARYGKIVVQVNPAEYNVGCGKEISRLCDEIGHVKKAESYVIKIMPERFIQLYVDNTYDKVKIEKGIRRTVTYKEGRPIMIETMRVDRNNGKDLFLSEETFTITYDGESINSITARIFYAHDLKGFPEQTAAKWEYHEEYTYNFIGYRFVEDAKNGYNQEMEAALDSNAYDRLEMTWNTLGEKHSHVIRDKNDINGIISYIIGDLAPINDKIN